MPFSVDISEEFSRLTWFQCIVYIQFIVAASILIFGIVGVAVGYSVGCLLLLALLQFLITVPGCIYNTQKKLVFLAAYIALQSVTGLSELIWFIYGLVNGIASVYVSIGLMILFAVQALSVMVSIFFRNRNVACKKTEDLDTQKSSVSDKKSKVVVTMPSSSLESTRRSVKKNNSEVSTISEACSERSDKMIKKPAQSQGNSTVVSVASSESIKSAENRNDDYSDRAIKVIKKKRAQPVKESDEKSEKTTSIEGITVLEATTQQSTFPSPAKVAVPVKNVSFAV